MACWSARILAWLSFCVAFLPGGSFAETALPVPQPLPCHRYDQIKAQLGERYDEAPISLGLQSNGNVLQVFTSKRSGTWTIVSTSPAGLACIVAAGDAWEAIAPAAGGPDA